MVRMVHILIKWTLTILTFPMTIYEVSKECLGTSTVIRLFVYVNTALNVLFLLLVSWTNGIFSFMIFVNFPWWNYVWKAGLPPYRAEERWNKQTNARKFDRNGCVFGACCTHNCTKITWIVVSFQLGTLIRVDSHLWFSLGRSQFSSTVFQQK